MKDAGSGAQGSSTSRASLYVTNTISSTLLSNNIFDFLGYTIHKSDKQTLTTNIHRIFRRIISFNFLNSMKWVCVCMCVYNQEIIKKVNYTAPGHMS